MPRGIRNTNKTSVVTETKKTRKRRPLSERIQNFDLQKLALLKQSAEQTIRIIAAESQRRQSEFSRLQDTSVLREFETKSNGVSANP